jgi:cytochrome c peroxidase
VLTVAAVLVLGAVGTARAHEGEDEKPKNLKVITEKELKGGMKLFNKGLGVKCEACHVKGEFDSDKKAEKEAGRTFLAAVVGEKDQAKRDSALKTLLESMKMKEAKNPADIWKGVDMFQKK